MVQISLAFVDDHPVLRSGIVGLFKENVGFKVVGLGDCAADVVTIANQAVPDVMIVDLNMPGSVMDSISRIAASNAKTKILIFTASTSVDQAIAALEAGATGYVLKGCSENELVTAVQAVSAGNTYISPCFASKVFSGMRNISQRRETTDVVRLSTREDQVLRLLMRGMTNREIASDLSLSDKTVKHYMTILMQRLQVRNRIEVVLAARELGIDHSNSRMARN